MGSQFIHIEGYARVESAKATKKQGNVKTIIGEAKREFALSRHVSNPKEPTTLYGSLNGLEELVYEYADHTTDAMGRKLRKDALCLLAGVISVPEDLTEKQWRAYKKATVYWLMDKYGKKNLKCMVEHEDESHRHIHFFVIPQVGQAFSEIHDGIKAKNEVKQRSKNCEEVKRERYSEAEGNKAYIEAMKTMQDDFYAKVSSSFGLTRLGPRRRRLSREQWKAEQIAALTLARAKDMVIKSERDTAELIRRERLEIKDAYDSALFSARHWREKYNQLANPKHKAIA